ncbi:unnamed protein product [Discula destructiva]
MAEPTRKASDPERRASTRTSRGVSLTHQSGPPVLELDDDNDEDYALMALGVMVSDGGYRPAPDSTYAPTSMHTPAASSATTLDARSMTPELAIRPESPQTSRSSTATSSSARLNRSSISKPTRGRDSLTLRHDGAMGHVAASTPASSLARTSTSSTASSEAAYMVADGPYRGPTAPSHAYSVYQQDTRQARPLSVATTSTAPNIRPESEYNGPRGPSHPYSMYPQMPLEEASPQPAVPAIPVGFTAVPDPYQRRLGPEGEELADIIGPDGHTEELPPYSRYPDDFYARKVRGDNDPERPGESVGAVAAGTSMAATATSESNSLPGAGGIGLAAHNPEFDARSIEDAGSPRSRHSSRSFTSDSHHEINTAAAAMSEKPQLGKWQKLAKKKACGVIPYWALGLTFTAVLIVIIIIAVVVSTLLSRHGGKPPKDVSPTNYQDSMPTVTITFDATPIPTPTDLPALAQGTFGLPLNVNAAPNTCFNDTAQTAAWSCNIGFLQGMALQLQITRNAPQLGNDGTYDVTLSTNYSSVTGDGESVNTNLLYGASAPLIQPAMSLELVNDTFDTDRGPAWFRMLPYNKTVIVPESLFAASPSSKNRRRDLGFRPSSKDFQRKGVADAGDKPWICVWPDTFVEMFIYAQQNSSYATQPSPTPTSDTATAATATGLATEGGAAATPSGDGSDGFGSRPMAAYPRAIKVKERRVNESPRAYCYQVEVQSDNSTTPVTDSSGDVVTVEIDEIEQSNGLDKRGGLYTRADGVDGEMSDCGCMWFSS